MNIGGFQKLTVQDFPGRVACIVFTNGCNYRCPFCHNALLVVDPSGEYTEEEVFAYLQKRRGVLDGVVITGGEPFLQPDLLRVLGRIKELGLDVKVDTNGTFPSRLREALDASLIDYVAMDIKNAKDAYAETVGLPSCSLSAVEESASLLLSGKVDYEFRTTIVSGLHTPERMHAIGAWIRGAKRYFLQPFHDSGNLIGSSPMEAPDADTQKQLLEIARLYIPSAELRG